MEPSTPDRPKRTPAKSTRKAVATPAPTRTRAGSAAKRANAASTSTARRTARTRIPESPPVDDDTTAAEDLETGDLETGDLETEDPETEDLETGDPMVGEADFGDAGDDEPAGTDEDPYALTAAPPPRRRSLSTVLAAVVGVLVVAALVFVSIELVDKNNQISTQNSLRSSALAAANRYGAYLSSYDYHSLGTPGSPWAEVDANSTASFRSDFDKTKANLSTLVKDYDAVATGKVVSAGLQSVSSAQATALLFVDQTVTNSAQKPGTTTQPLRVVLVMVRQHGHWLIDKLEVPS